MNNGRDVVTDYLWYAPVFMCDLAVNVHAMENKTTETFNPETFTETFNP